MAAMTPPLGNTRRGWGCQMAEGEQTATGGMTRRKAIKLGAVAGGAMWAAPAIHSMAAGAATGSCAPGQTFCSGAGCPGCGNVQFSNGTCGKTCSSDSECASGICNATVSPGTTTPYCLSSANTTTTCTSNSDCPVGSTCHNFGGSFTCFPMSCTADSNCPTGSFCSSEGGCLPAAC